MESSGWVAVVLQFKVETMQCNGLGWDPRGESCAHRSRAGFNASAYQAAIKGLDDPDKRGKNGDYNALQWGGGGNVIKGK